jgi:GntR family transcriptional regulator of vanillate catabolism
MREATSVVTELRKRIADGRYAAGQRLAEMAVAEELSVSRTPVRLAFRTLEQEGLLRPTGTRGYTVREFSERDVLSALEVRGALEGLAARRLAENGLSALVHTTLQGCIETGREVLESGRLVEESISAWSALNKRFHDAILHADESRVLADAIARNDHLPFASASSIIIDRDALPLEYEKLRFAQMQHELVLQALELGEAMRVEMLMREHAYVGLRYGKLFGLAAVQRFHGRGRRSY